MALNVRLATLLCLTIWICSVHTINGQEYSCCLNNKNTKIRQENIVSYRLQIQGYCPITSVMFLTKDNKKICWDPNEQYAQRAMRRVDQSKVEGQKKVRTPLLNTTNEMTTTGQTTAQQLNNSTQIHTDNTGDMTARTVPVGTSKPSRRRGKKRLRRRKAMKACNKKSSL